MHQSEQVEFKVTVTSTVIQSADPDTTAVARSKMSLVVLHMQNPCLSCSHVKKTQSHSKSKWCKIQEFMGMVLLLEASKTKRARLEICSGLQLKLRLIFLKMEQKCSQWMLTFADCVTIGNQALILLARSHEHHDRLDLSRLKLVLQSWLRFAVLDSKPMFAGSAS